MITIKRSIENPILLPNRENSWEAEAAFNGCVIKENDKFHLVYRAVSSSQVSSIGHATSDDGIHFQNRRQLIKPEYKWEIFGCEDPRVTKLNDKYFIFYTALSTYPFSPEGIKIGVAITKNFQEIEEKHPVTPFNSKAMALFPEKINGKITGILTVNTDIPPAKIGIAFFDKENQIWSKKYWQDWYSSLNTHVIPLQRTPNDHLEVGAPPIKTKDGWLLIYSYIKNYFTSSRIFGIEAVLLEADNPLKVIGRTGQPILVPEEEYELYGKIPNVIFPSGAFVQKEKLFIYYGATDTTCCLAICKLKDLMREVVRGGEKTITLERFESNPIIQPNPEHSWEAKATFNPGAIYENGKVHIVYRAMADNKTSVLGYASSADGVHIDERLAEPIYRPKEKFEMKTQPGNSGCEDPRLTKIGNKLYMCYTAFDGKNPPRVALTSIKIKDFLDKRWNWEKPVLISPPGIADKNACLLPEKINGKYVVFHRTGACICINFVDDLNFGENKWLKRGSLIKPRADKWDNWKVGVAAPPIKTKEGWFLLYHGVSEQNHIYRVGAVLLELANPTKIIGRIDSPILEPEMDYEKVGQVANVVFPCGAVVIKDRLFVYYGGADEVVGVATANLSKILEAFYES